tara:strand:- start:254 stop:517 length:264 start_codon:yes stop_codon:yes gene_type:complete
MATQLENFAFLGAGRKRKYDWDLWLDGNIWELKRPVDFQSNANAMRNGAKQAGRSRGLKVRTTVVDDDTLVIQAYEDVLHEFNAEPF